MWSQDIRGSIAYAKAIHKVGIITEEEKNLYDEIYSKAMTIQQFHSLLKVSEFKDFEPNQLIIKQNQKLKYIYHILKGKCSFHRKDSNGDLDFFFYMKKNFLISAGNNF